MTVQDDLATRYGAPSPWARRAVGAVVGVIVLAFAGWLTWTTLYQSAPDAISRLESFEVLDDHAVDAVVQVELAEGVQARCLLRAFAEDHAVVGEKSFEPDPAQGPVYTERLRTERLATAVESIGCTTPDQPRPR